MRSAYHHWYSILADYRLRDLTNADNVFAAISGIARCMKDMTVDEGLSGVWKNHLWYGLLRYVPGSSIV